MNQPLRPPTPDARWLWENEPCRAACPVHTDAGAYVTAIAQGRHRDAYLIARQPNPFPSICGRVCAAPCETACRRGELDAPIAIRALKRFVSERYGVESFGGSAVWHEAHGPVPPATGPSVGVVGGGPAGLSAAHDLRLAGHPVTIYEAQERLGGMMVLGIPEYRLARGLISREVEAILELGVEARTNCRVGAEVLLEELLAEHGSLFLAVGTGRGRDLDIPGHELDGVLRAVEFLLNVNQGFGVDLGERVVVVGGGNVAFDAARTALRAAAHGEVSPMPQPLGPQAQEDARRSLTTSLDVARSAIRAGVAEVTVVALESPEEIPAAPEEIAEAEEEGIRIVYRRGPHRIVGQGVVEGLETIGVASVFDAQHRFAPTFVPDTEEVLPADTVILAVGQVADVGFLDPAAGVELTRQGGVAVDRATLRTSHPRIWAGGDAAFGPRNLIDAIADGQRAAASIHAAARRRRRHAHGGSSWWTGLGSAAWPAATTPSAGSRSRWCPTIGGSASPRWRPAMARPRPVWRATGACAASTTSCSNPSCASCAGCAWTSARTTASRSCAPTTPGSARPASRRCCWTRRSASAAACASTAARPGRC